MANSLVKLTLESNQYEQGLRQAQKMWESFTNSVGLSAQKFTATSMAIGAITTALKVAKDAFFASQQNIGAWENAVSSAQSVYEGFLNTLNTGDISGFITNINTIVEAATNAKDALSDLADYNAFNQINVQNARTGLNNAIVDFRGGNGSRQDVINANERLKNELRERQKREQDVYEAEIGKVAAKFNVKTEDLKTLLSGPYEEWSNTKKAYKYAGTRETTPSGLFSGGNIGFNMVSALQGFFKNSQLDDMERLSVAARNIPTESLDALQKMGKQAAATETEISNLDKSLERVLSRKTPTVSAPNGGGGRGGSGVDIYGRISDEWQTAYRKSMVADIKPEDVEGPSGAFQALYDFEHQVTETLSPLESMQELLQDLINYRDQAQSPEEYAQRNRMVENQQQAIKDFKGETDETKGKTDKKSLAGALGGLATGMDQMVDGMEQLGIEVPEGIKDAISAISAVSSILTAISATIIAIEALVAADTFLPFSNGGVVRAAMGYEVPGNIGYDGVPSLLTSGEVVLNRAQQGVLASALQTGGLAGLQLEAVIAGEDIRLVINNNGRRTGRGEFIQTNFRG